MPIVGSACQRSKVEIRAKVVRAVGECIRIARWIAACYVGTGPTSSRVYSLSCGMQLHASASK